MRPTDEEIAMVLRPFSEIVRWDIGDDETDEDFYRPMSLDHAHACPVTVGHLRAAHDLLSRLEAQSGEGAPSDSASGEWLRKQASKSNAYLRWRAAADDVFSRAFDDGFLTGRRSGLEEATFMPVPVPPDYASWDTACRETYHLGIKQTLAAIRALLTTTDKSTNTATGGARDAI